MLPHVTSGFHAIPRRRFLQVGTCGFLGLGLADILRAEAESSQQQRQSISVIQIWLNGGPATIDMWDPKPKAPSEIRGEFGAIATAIPGVQFTEHMRHTAKIMNQCTLIRSLHHRIPDHVPGAQYLLTGNKPNANTEHPSIGSLVAKLLPNSVGMPAYFSLGEVASSGAGFLGAQFDPFRITVPQPPANVSLDGVVLPPSLDEQKLLRRQRLRDRFDLEFVSAHKQAEIVSTLTEFQQHALDILSSNRIGKAFDLSQESSATRELYGDGEFGRSTLTARRMIEAGSRFVTVACGQWDTHANNFATLRQQLPSLDKALAGLIVDLKQRGMLEKTMVICGGEFGRTPQVNGTAGRDHWSRAMSYFLAGGGLASGLSHGTTDDRGFDAEHDACSPDDLGATILFQLGYSPQHMINTTSGRPVELFAEGRVIDALLL